MAQCQFRASGRRPRPLTVPVTENALQKIILSHRRKQDRSIMLCKPCKNVMDFLKHSPTLSGDVTKKALNDNNVEASGTGARHGFAAGGRREGEASQTVDRH